MKKKAISFLLIISLVSGMLTGCSGLSAEFKNGDEDDKKTDMVRTGDTLNADSKWINSEIEGAIDESTQVNLKDDFYTYVNRDWILSTELSEDEQMVYECLSDSDNLVKERLLKIIDNEEDPDADGNVDSIPEDELAHDKEIVSTFGGAVSDWENRNSEGVEPLKKYLDYINDISSVEELRDYMINEDGRNLFNLSLAPVGVTTMELDAENYYVAVQNKPALSMGSSSSYSNTGILAKIVLFAKLRDMRNKYGYILGRLGYSEKEINRILKECYKFESGLADHMGSLEYYYGDWMTSEKSLETTSMDEIADMEGNYPLTEILQLYGYDSDRVIVMNPNYIKYLGRAFKQGNLEEIKDYLLIQTVSKSGLLLDEECAQRTLDFEKAEKESEQSTTVSGGSDGSGDSREQALSTDDQVVIGITQEYLSGCLDYVYISRYCKQEEKEDLTDLTEQIIGYYHEMIDSEDWLTESTRDYANEKLDAITRNILYPDTFLSYDYLDLSGETELLDMIASINAQRRGYDAYLLGQKCDRDVWDLDVIGTTTVNCFYSAEENSINILAGFTAGPEVYSIDMPIEEKLGKIGAVIGHEITHGFDSNGAKYDKDGNYRDWWEPLDKIEFTSRTATLQNYYNSLNAYPGSDAVSGVKVSTEATADMGGLKCVLGLAKSIDGFDYDLFFTSFEKMWGGKATYETIVSNSSDIHPVDCLRGNITVMQFDEFYDTYGIQKGDGMYMAPDERISVW